MDERGADASKILANAVPPDLAVDATPRVFKEGPPSGYLTKMAAITWIV